MKHPNKVLVGKLIKSSISELLDFKLANNLMPSIEGVELYVKNKTLVKLKNLNVVVDSYVDERIKKEWAEALTTPKGEFLIAFDREDYYRCQVLEQSDFKDPIKHISNLKSIELLLEKVITNNRQDIFKYMVDNEMFAMKPNNLIATVTYERKEMLEYMLNNGLEINGDDSILLFMSIISELPDMQLFLADRGAKFFEDNRFFSIHNYKRADWILSYIKAKEINDSLTEQLKEKPANKKAKI